MKNQVTFRAADRFLLLETLENRVLLDAGLGSEIAEFASEEELKSALIEKAVDQYEWLFDQEERFVGCIDWCWDVLGVPVSFAVDTNFDGTGGAVSREDSFSDTNTQVAGVDEGDIVETDGNYVYILSNNLVTIVDVRDQAHPRVASRVHLDDNSYGNEMYLDGDRLMVISSSWYHDYDIVPLGGGRLGGPAIGFAIDAIWAPSRAATRATVIDVTDRAKPAIVSETEIDGSVFSSRAIDGTGYLIVNDNLRFPTPELKTVKFISEDGTMERTINFYESEAEYRARLQTTILDVLPGYSTYDSNQILVTSDNVAGYGDTYTTKDPDYSSLVSVFTIDMHSELPTVENGTSVMMNAGHEIFMSMDSLYLFQHRWDGTDQTSIMKFDIDLEDGPIEPVASGFISGRLLDQFSADEFNGDLRIATTTGWGADSSSGVYVLEEVEDSLKLKGGVAGLARGEQIFSARFVGTRAYLVTFRRVDPLFSINLADPSSPVVEGELKIPGFSEYLQPLDEDHLLAIGRDADPQTGVADALQLSLFDVSDITDPQLVDRYTFEGGRSTSSPAEHDHHAFSYFPEYKTLAVPVHSNGGGTWIRGEDGQRDWIQAEWDQSLHVFRVDVNSGFSFAGSVEHPSEVRRSIRVNNGLYSISHDTLKVNSIENLDDLWGQLYYLPPANGGVVPKSPDATDIDRTFAAAATLENNSRFDLDGNSLVNVDDVDFLVTAVLNTNRGDANLDGKVNFKDFLILAENFGRAGGWAEGDFDGDGQVGFDDFAILADRFGD